MANLSDLGFKAGVISEAIVTTYNADGSANAAPMGLKLIDEVHLSMSVFNSSKTCQNLKAKKSAVVNLTSDIAVFYKSAIKDANRNGILPAEWFVKTETVEAPKLLNAAATVEVTVEIAESFGDRTRFSCSVQRLSAEKTFPQVYCRAFPLAMEAITHATRVKAFAKDQGREEETERLTCIIQDCAAIVERVAPDSQYTAVFADLLQRVESWRAKP
jgi:hypothetical protein